VLGRGAAVNVTVKVLNNNQFPQDHQPRLGVPSDPRQHLCLVRRKLPPAGLHQERSLAMRMPVCPPLFQRSIDWGQSFDLSLLPTAEEASQAAMVVRSLGQVCYNTALFSGISTPALRSCRGNYLDTAERARAERGCAELHPTEQS
jgi:hypothetical protein